MSEHYHVLINLGVGNLSAFHAALDGKFNTSINLLEVVPF
jgi:hypothetical protein